MYLLKKQILTKVAVKMRQCLWYFNKDCTSMMKAMLAKYIKHSLNFATNCASCMEDGIRNSWLVSCAEPLVGESNHYQMCTSGRHTSKMEERSSHLIPKHPVSLLAPACPTCVEKETIGGASYSVTWICEALRVPAQCMQGTPRIQAPVDLTQRIFLVCNSTVKSKQRRVRALFHSLSAQGHRNCRIEWYRPNKLKLVASSHLAMR